MVTNSVDNSDLLNVIKSKVYSYIFIHIYVNVCPYIYIYMYICRVCIHVDTYFWCVYTIILWIKWINMTLVNSPWKTGVQDQIWYSTTNLAWGIFFTIFVSISYTNWYTYLNICFLTQWRSKRFEWNYFFLPTITLHESPIISMSTFMWWIPGMKCYPIFFFSFYGEIY